MTTEVAASENSVYRSVPLIEVDGQRPALVTDLLLEATVTEQEGGLSTFSGSWANVASDDAGTEQPFGAEGPLQLGAEIIFNAGELHAPTELFRGKISAIEAIFDDGEQPRFHVQAEDQLMHARLQRKTTVYEDQSLRDIVEDIAGELGLRVNVDGLDDVLGTEVRLNETALAFLRRLLARYDADLQVVEDELQVGPRASVERGAITMTLRSQLKGARVVADLAQQLTAVTTSGWDVSTGSAFSLSSGDAADLGPTSENGGRLGSELMQEIYGDREQHLHVPNARNETEAQAHVDAAFSRQARSFVTVHGSCEGNPDLRVGSHVTLDGLGDRFDQTYYIVQASHRFGGDSGYVTDFVGETAFLGGA